MMALPFSKRIAAIETIAEKYQISKKKNPPLTRKLSIFKNKISVSANIFLNITSIDSKLSENVKCIII